VSSGRSLNIRRLARQWKLDTFCGRRRLQHRYAESDRRDNLQQYGAIQQWRRYLQRQWSNTGTD
jgi:hypothetical protein